MKKAFILSLFIALSSPLSGWAQDGQNEFAQRLHKQAIEAYKANDFEKAAQWWLDAEKIEEHWKYPFNLANIREHQKRWEEAWLAADRALRYGVPDDRREKVRVLIGRIESQLLKTHAFIELTVEPTTATVTLNGKDWPTPHKDWLEQHQSTFTVDGGPNWKPEKHVWEHPLGQKHKQIMRLVKSELRVGAMSIGGAPDGSMVYVDGRLIGSLPGLGPIRLPVGQHQVHITFEGNKAFETSIEILEGESKGIDAGIAVNDEKADEETDLNVGIQSTPEPEGINWVDWSILGSGVAVAGIGAGLLVWSGSVAEEANDLNKDSLDYASYVQKYDDLQDQHASLNTTGWILTGIGVAATVTGGVLLYLHSEPDSSNDSSVLITPMIAPGTGGITTFITF